MGLDEAQAKPHERLARWLCRPTWTAVNVLIRERMASEHAPRIPEVTAHLVEAGGKRLRPMLTLAAARMCGYDGPYHVHLAATVEFIHTATLLHDDVVDESQRRRGRPTANLLWDNKSSVLVGDYLFARAFQLMVETGNLRVLDILSNAAAVIAEGEVLQLTAAQDLRTDERIYLQVVRGKTAALFSAATEAGGVIAGRARPQVGALRDYGDALGIAFQIVDDLLDYGGSAAAIGKNIGDDFRERKLTLPVIKAVAQATPDERAFWVRVIEKGDQRDGDLAEAMAIMARHGAMEAARADALLWAERRAAVPWRCCPTHPLRDMLHDLADYVWSGSAKAAAGRRRPTSPALATRAWRSRRRWPQAGSANSPKQVAPDPDMRAIRHPGWADSAAITFAMTGARRCAGASRSLRIIARKAASSAASRRRGRIARHRRIVAASKGREHGGRRQGDAGIDQHQRRGGQRHGQADAPLRQPRVIRRDTTHQADGHIGPEAEHGWRLRAAEPARARPAPRSVAAASAEPPPMPEATGRRFVQRQRRPAPRREQAAARSTRLSGPADSTPPRPRHGQRQPVGLGAR